MEATTSFAALLILLFSPSSTQGRNIFSPRFQSSLTDQNYISPLSDLSGSNTDTLRDWVNVTQSVGRVLRVAEGESIEMECESIGSPVPRIEWFKGFEPVTEAVDESNEIASFSLGKLVTRFIADCAMPLHEGTYTCSAISGGVSKVSTPTTVVVEGRLPRQVIGSSNRCRNTKRPPRINLFSPLMLQTSGADVKLPCRARGNPAPRIYWTQNDELVHDSLDSRIRVTEDGDLYISKLRWSDMGRYSCYAENSHGKDSISTFLYPMKVQKRTITLPHELRNAPHGETQTAYSLTDYLVIILAVITNFKLFLIRRNSKSKMINCGILLNLKYLCVLISIKLVTA